MVTINANVSNVRFLCIYFIYNADALMYLIILCYSSSQKPVMLLDSWRSRVVPCFMLKVDPLVVVREAIQ